MIRSESSSDCEIGITKEINESLASINLNGENGLVKKKKRLVNQSLDFNTLNSHHKFEE